MHVCFYAPVRDVRQLEWVAFYAQDIAILHALGFQVTLATRYREIPWDADLYFVWWWTWAHLPLWKARKYQRPLVITGTFDYCWPHGGRDYLHRPAWQRFFLRRALAHASANVFVSQHEYDQVTAALPVTNPHVIPHGVDTDLYTPGEASGAPLLLTVASQSDGSADRKCLFPLVHALALILRAHPQACWLLVGERGSASRDLWGLAKLLGVADRVEFAGQVSEARKIALMQSCAVYVQPSRYEGFGLAILEAMSCGTPVVSSPVGAVPEVVGEAGVLVEGDAPQAIADAVCALLADALRRQHLGTLARQRAVEHFTLARRQQALGQVIQALLA